MKMLFYLITWFFIFGCTAHKTKMSWTSEVTGCPEKDIKISDDEMAWASNTWEAECSGKRFYCRFLKNDKVITSVRCKEDVKKIGP